MRTAAQGVLTFVAIMVVLAVIGLNYSTAIEMVDIRCSQAQLSNQTSRSTITITGQTRWPADAIQRTRVDRSGAVATVKIYHYLVRPWNRESRFTVEIPVDGINEIRFGNQGATIWTRGQTSGQSHCFNEP